MRILDLGMRRLYPMNGRDQENRREMDEKAGPR
jgi:hypothetical protein